MQPEGVSMYAIDVGTYIRAPIERVWEFLSDQEGYTFASVVNRATLLREGHSERDGVGAVVRVWAMGAPVTWEIVTFEPPARLEYRITKVLLPMRHKIGAVEFTSRGDGTDVRWTSDFEVPVPVIGRVLGPAISGVFSFIHQTALNEAKEILEAAAQTGSGAPAPGAEGGSIRIPDWMKKVLKVWIWAAIIGHTLETPIAYRAAKKRGKDPKKYVLRTLALGVIALIPLLRSEPEITNDQDHR
jgi:uncharacterized protein YndB with AHSA1/START domain